MLLNQLELKTVIIDGNSLLYFIGKQMDWINNLDYFIFSNLIVEFLDCFSEFKVIVVFDGSLPTYKLNERIRRMNENIETIKQILSLNASGGKVSSVVNSRLMPPFAISVLFDTCLKSNVETVVAIEEADPLIVKLAVQNDAIVFSQDSDFLISTVPGYCPFEYFEILDNVPHIRLFKSEMISKALNIPPSKLQLFSMVVESDFWVRQEYESFVGNLIGNTGATFPKLARIINRVNDKQGLIARVDPKWKDKMNLIFDNYSKLESTNIVQGDGFVIMGEIEAGKMQLLRDLMTKSTKFDLKYVEIIFKNQFWGRPFIGSSNVWDISQSIRQKLYKELDAASKITEYYPTFGGMKTREFQDVDSISSYFIGNQNGFVEAVRYLIMNSKKQLCNYQVVGLAAYMVRISTNDRNSNPIAVSNNVLSLLASLQTILYSLSLISALKSQAPTIKFWEWIHGPTFHFVLMQAKRGSPPRTLIVGKSNQLEKMALFRNLYKEITNGLEELIEEVFDYGLEI